MELIAHRMNKTRSVDHRTKSGIRYTCLFDSSAYEPGRCIWGELGSHEFTPSVRSAVRKGSAPHLLATADASAVRKYWISAALMVAAEAPMTGTGRHGDRIQSHGWVKASHLRALEGSRL